jgi:hypothetical protein
MARLSIYVTDELKARMDEVGNDVNWSEVVRPAIQAAITIHEHRRSPSMATAIERLRASKREAEKEDGKAAGREWAESKASYRELDSVSGILLDPEEWRDVKQHLLDVFGIKSTDEKPTEQYIASFLEGAQEFFDEVKDKL